MAAADVIADALGQRFVDSVPLNMERAWAESAPNVPVICLLSPGQQSTQIMYHAEAEKEGCKGRFTFLKVHDMVSWLWVSSLVHELHCSSHTLM